MTKEEIQQTAKLMFLENHGRKKVIEMLNENGIFNEEAEKMATQAYLAVKDQIRQRVEVAEESEGGGGMGWLVYVVILLVINGLSALFGWSFWIY